MYHISIFDHPPLSSVPVNGVTALYSAPLTVLVRPKADQYPGSYELPIPPLK
jgi:hypothetical protein